MENCKFCTGKAIKANAHGEGIPTMESMLDSLFGTMKEEDEEDNKCKNGIILRNGNELCFDNSSREYQELSIEISYCPFCGEELEKRTNEESSVNHETGGEVG